MLQVSLVKMASVSEMKAAAFHRVTNAPAILAAHIMTVLWAAAVMRLSAPATLVKPESATSCRRKQMMAENDPDCPDQRFCDSSSSG